MITQSKIGDSCLKITDQELARYNIWVQDIEKLEGKCKQFFISLFICTDNSNQKTQNKFPQVLKVLKMLLCQRN